MKKSLLPLLFVLAFVPASAHAAEAVCLDPALTALGGEWRQVAGGKVIATKVIVPTIAGIFMAYADLDDGFVGGKYSALTIQEDGTFLVYEDYGTHVTRHTLTIENIDTIYGHQYDYNRGGAVSEYIMRRVKK